MHYPGINDVFEIQMKLIGVIKKTLVDFLPEVWPDMKKKWSFSSLLTVLEIQLDFYFQPRRFCFQLWSFKFELWIDFCKKNIEKFHHVWKIASSTTIKGPLEPSDREWIVLTKRIQFLIGSGALASLMPTINTLPSDQGSNHDKIKP